MAAQLIAVTGANGFLGSHVVRILIKHGYNVRALLRSGSNKDFLLHTRAQIEETTYDESDLTRLFADCDAVVHCAAYVRDWGAWELFAEGNIRLTEKVAAATTRAGVKTMVHISTNAVMGEEDCRRSKSEEETHTPRLSYSLEGIVPSAMNYYRTSKAAGEKRAIALALQHGLNLTVLRPVWIYGPREFHAGPYEYCKTVLSGVPCLPGAADNLFHTVYVEDVARAVVASLRKPGNGKDPRIYTIGPRTIATMQEFYGHFCKALGRKPPRLLPKWLLYPLVLPMELGALAFKTKQPPLLTRARLYMMYANNAYDVSKAERELGFVATANPAAAAKKTIRWWKMFGYL